MVLFPKVANGSSIFAHSFKEDYFYINEDGVKIVTENVTNNSRNFRNTHEEIKQLFYNMEKFEIKNRNDYEDFLLKTTNDNFPKILFVKEDVNYDTSYHNNDRENALYERNRSIHEFLLTGGYLNQYQFNYGYTSDNTPLSGPDFLDLLKFDNFSSMNSTRIPIRQLEYYYYKEPNINLLLNLFTDNTFNYNKIYLENRRNRTNGVKSPGIYDEKLSLFGTKQLINNQEQGTNSYILDNFSSISTTTRNGNIFDTIDPADRNYNQQFYRRSSHRNHPNVQDVSSEFSYISRKLFLYQDALESEKINVNYTEIKRNDVPDTDLVSNIKELQKILINSNSVTLKAKSHDEEYKDKEDSLIPLITYYSKEDKEESVNNSILPSFNNFNYRRQTQVGLGMKDFSTINLFSTAFSISLSKILYTKILTGKDINFEERFFNDLEVSVKPLLYPSDYYRNQNIRNNYTVDRFLELKNLILSGKIEEWSFNRRFLESHDCRYVGWNGLTDNGLSIHSYSTNISSENEYLNRDMEESLDIIKRYLIEKNVPNFCFIPHPRHGSGEYKNPISFLFEGEHGLEFISEFFIHYENLCKLYHDYIIDNSNNTEESSIALAKFYNKYDLKYYDENKIRVNYAVLTPKFILSNTLLSNTSYNFADVYRKPHLRDNYNYDKIGLVYSKELSLPFRILEKPTLKSGLEV